MRKRSPYSKKSRKERVTLLMTVAKRKVMRRKVTKKTTAVKVVTHSRLIQMQVNSMIEMALVLKVLRFRSQLNHLKIDDNQLC